MLKKLWFASLILITVQTINVYAAEKIDKILSNSNYSQQQKIEKISIRTDELLNQLNSINQADTKNSKKNNREIKKLKLYKDIQTEINFVNIQGLSPLKFCALCGDFNTSEKLIALGAPLNSNQNSEPSVLMCALKSPNASFNLIKLFVEQGADCDFYFTEKLNNVTYKNTVLHYACLSENPEIISYIISKSSKNLDSKMPELNKNGIVNSKNALALLCQIQVKYFKENSDLNFYSCIDQLLKKKPGLINSEYFDNGKRGTVLHMAAKNNEKQLYQLLRKHGANNQIKDNQGQTPLEYLKSFCKNDVDLLELLYEDSSKDKQNQRVLLLEKIMAENINQQTSSNQKSALLVAITNKDYSSFELLLNSGADYELSDSLGKNAIHYAVEENDLKVLNLLMAVNFIPDSETLDYAIYADKIEIVKYLLEQKAYSKNAVLNALEIAQNKEEHKYDVVELLISQQLNQLENLKYANNITLLMYIIKYGNAELVKQVLPVFLRANKKAMEQKDINGWTPFLYAAVYNPDPKVLKILRMYGANVSAQDIHKNNAVSLAKLHNPNKDEIIETLNKYGVY